LPYAAAVRDGGREVFLLEPAAGRRHWNRPRRRPGSRHRGGSLMSVWPVLCAEVQKLNVSVRKGQVLEGAFRAGGVGCTKGAAVTSGTVREAMSHPNPERYFFAVLVKLQSVAPPEVPLPVTDTSLGDVHLKVMLSVSSLPCTFFPLRTSVIV